MQTERKCKVRSFINCRPEYGKYPDIELKIGTIYFDMKSTKSLDLNVICIQLCHIQKIQFTRK